VYRQEKTMSYDLLKKAEQCFAYMSVLIELSNGKKITGYDMVVCMKKFGFKASAGTIYRRLDRLSKDGLVREEQQPWGKTTKTVYEMTEKGEALFHEFKHRWKQPLEYVTSNLQ
jgi:DNA-binding PadR family transcriptional regulator